MKDKYSNQKIVLGIDRLDYIKGIPQKIAAFSNFLDEHPEYVEKVVLIQVAIPTRSDVDKYREIKSTVDELVGRINGKYGTPTYLPVVMMHQSISKALLAALYKTADVCMITSSRDGMNLVALEYMFLKGFSGEGRLIISEFAGASDSFIDAQKINPWDIKKSAGSIFTAISCKAKSCKIKDLKSSCAKHWAMRFVGKLNNLS